MSSFFLRRVILNYSWLEKNYQILYILFFLRLYNQNDTAIDIELITRATQWRVPYKWRQICRNGLLFVCTLEN